MDFKLSGILFVAAAGLGVAAGILFSNRESNVLGAYSLVVPKRSPVEIITSAVAGATTIASTEDLSLIEAGLAGLKTQVASLAAQVAGLQNQNTPVAVNPNPVTAAGSNAELEQKVDLLLRQLDSDRDNYSLGLDTASGVPNDLSSDTLDVGGGDFVVDENGNINATDLTISGRMTMGGGNPGAGKVMTSDADGLATWQAATEGVTDHSLLSNLVYASSGHTGFEPTLAKGNLTETGSGILTIAGGGNAVIGSGTTIQIQQSDSTRSGYLSSGDWNIFNNKVSSQWAAGGSDIYYAAGNVGIGTTIPAGKLTVQGNILATQDDDPVLKGYVGTNLSWPSDVFVSGKYAYVVNNGNDRLAIFNISNPAAITAEGHTSENLDNPNCVKIAGKYAYVTSSNNNRLAIFDISDPNSIVVKGYTTTNLNNPRKLFISGKYAYVTSNSNRKLVIFDISNPNSIVARGTITVPYAYSSPWGFLFPVNMHIWPI